MEEIIQLLLCVLHSQLSSRATTRSQTLWKYIVQGAVSAWCKTLYRVHISYQRA